ncbi:hypothetical protein F4804DRAFT_348537 [Jackrogersella minutella]|nr:hypothetical protein F4804DRAFT_348537 [Jackrogersella minutella]
MANMRMDSPSRQQPWRSTRDKRSSTSQLSQGLDKMHTSSAGVKKATTKQELKHGKKGRRFPKGGRAKATKALEKRVSLMETEVAWLEQQKVLGITGEPDYNTPNILSVPTPKSAKFKRGRKKRRQSEDMYMDDFLLSDADGEEEAGKNKEEKEGKKLQRGERWIPELAHRGRVSRKPRNVPFQTWMAYCQLDDYIYRCSLTDEEILTHPLMDDVYSFQNGGSKPVTPAGFQWDERKNLVPAQGNRF